jgi:6-phospho-beta-glucosidase
MFKITVMGGGSTYTPELVKGFLGRQGSLPLNELWLMDIDQQRLEIVGGFAQRIVKAAGSPFKVILSTDQKHSLEGAAYVITQLRVGQMQARREDEYLGMRHGLIGQETTGIGGLAKALRTIPVILDIARDMQELAPGSMLINFTNPSGLVTEALARHAPRVPSVGLCNSAITMKMIILHQLALQAGEITTQERANLKTLGLNHLSWHYGFEVDGVDIWDEILATYVELLRQSQEPEFEVVDVLRLGMIPNSYLRYFYYTARMLEKQRSWPPSRAELVMEIEKQLLEEYRDPSRCEVPMDLMKRGGAWYSTVATQVINAHFNDLGEVHVANVRQGGAVPGYPEDWVMELPSLVNKAGIRPLSAKPLPDECFQLIQKVKHYELLTVQAAVTGDRAFVRQALLVHPLGPDQTCVDVVMDDLLQTNLDYLPQFGSK